MHRGKMSKLFCFPILGIVSLVAGSRAQGAPIRYALSGAIDESFLPGVLPGTPVLLSFDYDPSWPFREMPASNQTTFTIPFSPTTFGGSIGGTQLQTQSSGTAFLILNAGLIDPLFTCGRCDLIQFLVVTNAGVVALTLADTDHSNGLTLALPNPLPATGWEFAGFQIFNPVNTVQFAEARVQFVPEMATGLLALGPLVVGVGMSLKQRRARSRGEEKRHILA
jgi:hypothetical protein